MAEDGKYRDILKRSGLKNTKHRNSILEILENSRHPLTAEQIFVKLLSLKISINLSSVYRTLDTLISKGMLVKSTLSGDNKALFELNRQEHKHNLICFGCRKIIPVDGCPLAGYENLLKEKTGFDVTGHKLEIYGYCQDCQKKLNPDKKI